MIYLYISLCLLVPHLLYTQENKIISSSITQCTTHHFLKPITFTQSGLQLFVKQVYNHPEYANFLAHNMHHITQFLQQTASAPYNCIPSVLHMFGNKFKQTTYINSYAYADLLDEIAPLLQAAISHNMQDSLKKQISKAMYDQMLYKFDYLKQDPNAYFNELTDAIVKLTHKNPATEVQAIEIRKAIIVFLEITLSKLVWNPTEYKAAWENVLRIAQQLEKINATILHNNDDLNALFITILERFYLFLDLSYAEINVEFYSDIQKQVIEQQPLLFTLCNTPLACNGLRITSEYFQTKLQRFEQILTLAEAKTRAYQEGIYAQHYIPPRKQN